MFPSMHLYFHVPFCGRRCSYCDFAIAVRRRVPTEAYVEALLAEWAGWQPSPAWDSAPEIGTIYFGGGTPSRLAADALERILDRVRTDRSVAEGAEVTLEANPEDVEAEAARAWLRAGINRISLGAQSFEPAVLEWMHRSHGPDRIARAVGILRDVGHRNLSLDLIFGLPVELERSWMRDLERAVELEPEHLSVYGLTIESHTPLARWVERGETRAADEERYAAEFLAADQRLRAAGYEHYEVSNYARPGRRAIHNSAYWQGRSYLGLGPSAHSRFGDARQWNLAEWVAYSRAIEHATSPVAGREVLDLAARELERLYLGLRTAEGLPVELIAPDRWESWQASGWADPVGATGRWRLTPEGWLRMDALVTAAAGRCLV
jgi:oxygen-independent coproporphyrinogen-3 oxidase